MKTRHPKQRHQERRWVVFSNGCIHGVQHTDLVCVRSVPNRSFSRSSISVLTLSRTFGLCAAIGLLLAVLLLLTGCQSFQAQKGGRATVSIGSFGHTNAASLVQGDNPKEPSRQTVQSEHVMEYVLPPGSELALGAEAGSVERGARKLREEAATRAGSGSVILQRAVPVRLVAKDRTETTIGAAQRDTIRDWTGKAANLQPVMWAGVVMMTLVAGALVYFGWYTKAAVAEAVGIGMIVLAQVLPDHGAVIFFGGMTVFALAALLILYSYYKGQWDRNGNGVPDFLESATPKGV